VLIVNWRRRTLEGGSARLRSGQGQRQEQKPRGEGDTSNEVRKGTFLKSFDNDEYASLTRFKSPWYFRLRQMMTRQAVGWHP
jgi:hypothetical protein